MAESSAARIADVLRAWIAEAPPGMQLPSTRTLMAEHGVSPVTVRRAMAQLIASGLVESRPGVGCFAREVRTPRPSDYGWQTSALRAPQVRASGLSSTQRPAVPDAIKLHSGYPARDLLPERLVRAALARVARTEDAVTRSPTSGNPELREWFAGQVAATARDVLVIAGSQSGLSSIFRAVVGPGRPLVIESPTYWGAVLAAEQAGVTLVPVPSGAAGPDPADVERAFSATGARAFYAQPTFANPTGVSWDAVTGQSVLDIVRAQGAFLIEDDWAHDLGIDADPHPLVGHDDEGHVIYLRSLTKSVSPAVRVAALIARGPARDRIVADRAAEAMYVSGVLQAAALDVVSQPGWTTHRRRLRELLRDRRDLLLESLRTHAPELHVAHVPVGGLNLWTQLPDAVDAAELVRACETRGLFIAAGTEWFPAEPSGSFIRLNFSSESPDRFAEVGQILRDSLRALM